MARTDDDTWDISESVGATALGVAAGRAAETASAEPLIVDPYAQLFLDAAGDGTWNLFANGELPPELTAADPRFEERRLAMLGYTAARTKYFDDFFLTAADAGVRQAVILAAGLDARTWRLAWPAGSVVYEIDQPKVLAFKTKALDAHGVEPIARFVGVGIDLRQDWPTALRDAGFDPGQPTAWSAEGLLPYLSAEAQDLLFDRIHRLSAPGSRIAVEAFTNEFFSADTLARREEQMAHYRSAAEKLGRPGIAEHGDLFYTEDRPEVTEWLAKHGWQPSGLTAEDLMARNGRFVPADLVDATPQSVFIEASLPS